MTARILRAATRGSALAIWQAAHVARLIEAERRLAELGYPRIPGTPAPFMRAVELPSGDARELWQRLYEEHRVEVPVYEWDGRRVLRVSTGPYNDEGDLDRLVTALATLVG